ncbi:hypothetical protein ACLOJK_034714 [Asimina triloba]
MEEEGRQGLCSCGGFGAMIAMASSVPITEKRCKGREGSRGVVLWLGCLKEYAGNDEFGAVEHVMVLHGTDKTSLYPRKKVTLLEKKEVNIT